MSIIILIYEFHFFLSDATHRPGQYDLFFNKTMSIR